MKDEEKNLIENLFHRLKNTELNSFEKDNSADELIQNLVKKQPSSSYYMTQTILIQETAIKKMSLQIEELKKRIKMLKTAESNKKPSFLSNFFKKNPTSQTLSQDNNVWKDDKNNLQSHYSNSTISSSPTPQSIPTTTGINNKNSSFLSNALQTATGVAGGMILGNMLMNVFNHSKPEEEVFDAINNNITPLQHHEDENLLNTNHANLTSYEKHDNELDDNVSTNLDASNDHYEIDYEDVNHEDEHFL